MRISIYQNQTAEKKIMKAIPFTIAIKIKHFYTEK
jgi:hypothetical protein